MGALNFSPIMQTVASFGLTIRKVPPAFAFARVFAFGNLYNDLSEYVSVATLFRLVASFSNRNRFALNGIQGIACFIVFSWPK